VAQGQKERNKEIKKDERQGERDRKKINYRRERKHR
jgi:hypothetical protein